VREGRHGSTRMHGGAAGAIGVEKSEGLRSSPHRGANLNKVAYSRLPR
jgi:hypothetical protein